MKLYYRAVAQDGKSVSGLIDAKDEKGVANYLRSHQLTPVKITRVGKTSLLNLSFLKKAKLKDRVFFTRQLSSMLTSGLTLMQSLEILKNQTDNMYMVETIQDIITGVEGGKLFSSTLEKKPDFFPPVYVALIRTAEATGLLDKVLLKLADNLEKQDKLEKTVKSALMYPAIILIIMFLVMFVMSFFVLPQLTTLYKSINVPLPLTTKLVLATSAFFLQTWYIILGLMAGGVFYFRKWYKTDSGRHIVDSYILKMPIFGKIITQTTMAEFTRTFGLLVGAGSLVVDSLNKSADVVSNILYKDAIIMVSRRVEKGITIGNAMSATTLFPPMVVEMVKIGEQTGKLEDSLIRASEYFEREVDQIVKNLTTLIEPIIIVFLAVGVGFLMFSVITPIYGLISSIQ